MGAGHVDHHRGVDPGAVVQVDSGHPVAVPAYVDHLGVEPEHTALGLGGPLQVVGG